MFWCSLDTARTQQQSGNTHNMHLLQTATVWGQYPSVLPLGSLNSGPFFGPQIVLHPYEKDPKMGP